MEETYPPRYGMFPIIPFKVLVWLRIIFPKLFHDVLAHIAIILLDLRCNSQLIFGWDGCHLTALPQEVQHELRDISSGNWDVFYGTSDNVSFRAGYDVGDTVARVNNCARQCPVYHAIRRPGSRKGKYSLDSDIETLDVEGLEEDLCGLFPVLGWIKWRLGLLTDKATVRSSVP